jgi:hypothetical protein
MQQRLLLWMLRSPESFTVWQRHSSGLCLFVCQAINKPLAPVGGPAFNACVHAVGVLLTVYLFFQSHGPFF